MKFIIFVNELNCYGRYVSALDRDNAFSEKDNPEGLFKNSARIHATLAV